ncbi:mitogen-activated protein kinase kinase kinase 2-like [Pyrus ussuriensis x Pyrus communis]|uniref:Mitogen-activated protein kinase kinase kinase 2-like n=1 Tax=Pyrus ussuriensis x Pyrus communis TaxID=2448454 RepID=A0A5N5GC08_9ROSA|nr:mitogen-activated protein kinase kinase kinase 2-like [Pyrus ussuriensis x Pyrus communis]
MCNHGERWLRGALIGKGGFGSVFLATPDKRKRGLLTGNFPALMAHEAEVLFEIKGCSFISEWFGEEITTTKKGNKVHNLLLEYAAGGTLDGLIQRSNGHGLPEAHVKAYTPSILEELIHIHKCDYVHCDLKPENILLVPSTTTSTVVAKIADFGLSKRSKEKYSGWRSTPRYLSIEALKDIKQDESSDILPWELKPGCSDHVDILDVAMLDHLRTSRIAAEISYVVRDFLESCLAMKPGRRLTAEELLSHPVKVVNSALGQAYGVCCFKPSAKYHASTAIVPRI